MQLTDGRAAPNERRLVEIVEEAWQSVNGLRVLEVGCGQGSISVAFAERGAQPVCLDSAHRAVAHSLARHVRCGLPATGVTASGFDIPLRSGSVDVVVSGGLLEHFPRELRQRMLAEMKRVSRGCVVALIPNGLDPFYRCAKWCLQQTGRWPWGEELSLPGLTEEFESVGMRVLHETSYDFHNSVQLFERALALQREQAAAILKWAAAEARDEKWRGYRLVTIGTVT